MGEEVGENGLFTQVRGPECCRDVGGLSRICHEIINAVDCPANGVEYAANLGIPTCGIVLLCGLRHGVRDRQSGTTVNPLVVTTESPRH